MKKLAEKISWSSSSKMFEHLHRKENRQVAPETTAEPDKISDGLKSMQHDCTPAQAAPPQEYCLETEGQELDIQPPPHSSEEPVQVIYLTAQQPERPHTDNHSVVKHLNGGKILENKILSTDCFGFPNVRNTCYMNSCLQSLLNSEEFMRDINRQEVLWRAVPEARLLRKLINIRDCHESTDYGLKGHRLRSFKREFSKHVPEYMGSAQKDAHEFLTLLLNEVQKLSSYLKWKAALLGRTYTCPVEDHHVFKMENMRTCKSCGHQSSYQEEFTSLSLGLVPEGSVINMLETYLKEQKLEFRCDCGGTTSGLKSSFDTLPRVLILHLKRFGFTQEYKLQKLDNLVRLQRDLVISSKQGGGCYSLVSVISHYGGTESGHYISNSVHPEESPYSTTDCWLTYNDAQVFHTTGSAVCEEQQHSAYILFYNRM